MNEDDLETLKLEIIRKLATCPGGKTSVYDLMRAFRFYKDFFQEALALLLKDYSVRFKRFDYDLNGKDAYMLTESGKTKYGITHTKPFFTYIPQNTEPTKYVNIVNSAGVIVGTKEVMEKGTLRTILAGICIFTIIAIVVLIFIS